MKKNEIDKHSKTESSYRFSLLLTDVAEGGLNLPFERCGVLAMVSWSVEVTRRQRNIALLLSETSRVRGKPGGCVFL